MLTGREMFSTLPLFTILVRLLPMFAMIFFIIFFCSTSIASFMHTTPPCLHRCHSLNRKCSVRIFDFSYYSLSSYGTCLCWLFRCSCCPRDFYFFRSSSALYFPSGEASSDS